MGKTSVLTRGLAVIGTALVWLPLVLALMFGIVRTVEIGRLHGDWLLPAELFPLALVGGLMLLWAARRARSRLALIGWSLVVAVALLFGGQALAVVTGLASGETPAVGWQWAIVTAMIIGYAVATAVIGVGGLLLVRDLRRKRASLKLL